jgi:hypothetical protein
MDPIVVLGVIAPCYNIDLCPHDHIQSKGATRLVAEAQAVDPTEIKTQSAGGVRCIKILYPVTACGARTSRALAVCFAVCDRYAHSQERRLCH